MTFFSLLYERAEDEKKNSDWMKWVPATRKNKERTFEYIGTHMVEVKREEEVTQYPVFYEDLNLDQIMEQIYEKTLYPQLSELYTHLISDEKIIYYRQEIMKDFESLEVYEAFIQFQNSLQEVKRKISESKLKKYDLQQDCIYLEAINLYCECINALEKNLKQQTINSRGVKKFIQVLCDYKKSNYFEKLNEQIIQIKEAVESIHYQLILHENKVTVRIIKNEETYKEVDYSERLKKALGILQAEEHIEGQGKISLFMGEELNPLEVKIIEVLRSSYKMLFKQCHEMVVENNNFVESFIERLHNEIPFYLNFINYMRKMKEKKLSFAYPTFSENISIKGIYDLSLAQKKEVVTNDFVINKEESGACITGANQGGKTTFLRSIGQLIYFSALGLPVAASEARLPLYNKLYTHFSQAEDADTNEGKLKEELIKLKEVFKQAGGQTVVLMNELFSSTTAHDAFEMSRHVVKQLESLGCTTFLVTHVAALAKEDLKLVSMVAELSENETGKRTYKIVRKKADGLAYVQGLIKKYNLSYEAIRGRIGNGN